MNVVTIGGGGGHAQVLKGLKHLSGIKITAICPSTDSGGSTGLLIRDYNIPGYLGDLTKCIAGLCSDDQFAKALLHRFDKGNLSGHSVKNILFLGLEQTNGIQRALDKMYQICNLGYHRVIPVTVEPTELCASLKIGNQIQGETQIDTIAQNPLWHPDYHAIQSIYLKPKVSASSLALEAIEEADWLVVSPRDLYSSILPVLLPEGIKESIVRGNPKVAIVLNIMTKKGETDKYKAMDFIARIEQHIGLSANVILCNSTQLHGDLLIKYALEQKVQLVMPDEVSDPRIRLAHLAMITDEGSVYHDPNNIAFELNRIFKGR